MNLFLADVKVKDVSPHRTKRQDPTISAAFSGGRFVPSHLTIKFQLETLSRISRRRRQKIRRAIGNAKVSSHGNSGGPVIAAIRIAHGSAAYRGGLPLNMPPGHEAMESMAQRPSSPLLLSLPRIYFGCRFLHFIFDFLIIVSSAALQPFLSY